ncbi:hypothetical protein ACFRMQ_21230 [Kitasatospora sp. NPDC056783]|uniref:hypothetical protein n=1 Tax=Kitasatospora sp. NPDC056783 TaxID=3345943 RepID=UPI00367866B9
MATHRGHPLTIARTEALVSPLAAPDAEQLPTTTWLRDRARLFSAAAKVKFHLITSAALYTRMTGEQLSSGDVGRAYSGPASARLPVPLVYLNLEVLGTRRAVDKALAHEVMHVGWPSYGHKAIAFERAQQVLNAVGVLSAAP